MRGRSDVLTWLSAVGAADTLVRLSRSATIRIIVLAAALLLVLFGRRGDQLLHPQVWDEDGTGLVRDFITVGPASLTYPLNGYLVAVPRLISYLSMSVSMSYYPAVSTIVAWSFTIAALLAISLSPLIVRGGALLAFAALLVPSSNEVFGLPLYTFWWAGLLVVAAALWRPKAGGAAVRLGCVLLGGLSSPIIVLATPLFLIRAAVLWKQREEIAVSAAALCCAAVQLLVLRSALLLEGRSFASIGNAVAALPTYLGNYVFGGLVRAHVTSQSASFLAGAVVTLVLIAVSVLDRRRNLAPLAALLYLWFGSIALSAARVDVAMIDPVINGPRYFFYAFVFEGWFLAHVAFSARAPVLRAAAGVMLVVGAASALPVLGSTHAVMDWTANVGTCALAGYTETYAIPVEYDGSFTHWQLQLTGAQCRAMAARDLLAHLPGLEPATFPYFVESAPRLDPTLPALASAGSLVRDRWNGTDFQHTKVSGLNVAGSYRTGDADTGSVTLRLRRGDRVLYRSGPIGGHQRAVVTGEGSGRFATVLPVALEWTALRFENPKLPDVFTVVFEDDGAGYGEWSALALSAKR